MLKNSRLPLFLAGLFVLAGGAFAETHNPGSLVHPGALAKPMWSTGAHWDLIQIAFNKERPDCRDQIRQGSEWVDSTLNQLPSKSYMHAMRSSASQSVDDARKLMADFIQDQYSHAADYKAASTQQVDSTPDDPTVQFSADGLLITDMDTYLKHCYARGVGLHPVMDSTSPAHADFAIWSITDIDGMLQHGDLPHSIENDKALARDPDLMKRTVGLMRVVDKMYLDLGQRDFRFEDGN